MSSHLVLAIIWLVATIVWAIGDAPGWPGRPLGGAAWFCNVALGIAVFFLR